MSNQQHPHLIEAFTASELEVLRLMTEGKSNREIAAIRTIAVETVRWYTKQIYRKLGVNSRARAILRAIQLRLFDTDSTEPELFFVSLPTTTSAVVRSINLQVDEKQQERLIAYLKEQNVLLILDKFEHLLEMKYGKKLNL